VTGSGRGARISRVYFSLAGRARAGLRRLPAGLPRYTALLAPPADRPNCDIDWLRVNCAVRCQLFLAGYPRPEGAEVRVLTPLPDILRCYGLRRSRSTGLPRFTSRWVHNATQFGPGPLAIRVGVCQDRPVEPTDGLASGHRPILANCAVIH
jgi:hypothetical protein